MKNLHKIIALFAFIFITGIIVTAISINTSLNKTETTEEAVEIQKDTLYLLKVKNKTV
jgi:preprotein translocase subunit SecG